MTDYRVRESGDIKSQGEIRKLNPNTSIPKIWDSNVCDSLGIDLVMVSPKPESNDPFKQFVLQGAIESNGGWVQNYVEMDLFYDDVPNENPAPDALPRILFTKAEKEANYVQKKDASHSKNIRVDRDRRLAITDWHGLSDTVMSEEMTAYRQSLRDIPDQAGFPHEVTWPDSP
tara:strand:+ start:1603 stop:2121 length:519 start_codon:yes stop_codon:yes gene_type:complete